MTQIIIGTTPTITYNFKVVSVSDLTKAILTIKCAGQVILEKTLAVVDTEGYESYVRQAVSRGVYVYGYLNVIN